MTQVLGKMLKSVSLYFMFNVVIQGDVIGNHYVWYGFVMRDCLVDDWNKTSDGIALWGVVVMFTLKVVIFRFSI